MTVVTQATPGWYPVPSGGERWWDGTAWTDHQRQPEQQVHQTLTVKGHNGTVSFDGNWVTISRTGGLARMSVGKGEKRIPLPSITAVQWKPAGPIVNGFIQFTVPGGNESRSRAGGQTTSAVGDENSVVFTRKQGDAFAELRKAIEDAIVARM